MTTSDALAGLIKFCSRDAWAGPLATVMEEHFGDLSEAFDLDFEDIDDELGEGMAMMLWGCAFEDFLTRRFEPDGRNVVDDYLKRRGFKEAARNKAYMKALRDSVMSLYEASDVRPGKSLLMRDLFRGGEPIRVREKSGTRTIKPWDRLAARIVPEGDGYALGGGLLPLSQAACDVLFGALKLASEGEVEADLVLDDEQLATIPPLMTMAWLTAAMNLLDQEPRPVVNAEGDPLLAHDLRFPLAKGVRERAVAKLLDAQANFEAASDTFWNWWGEPLRPEDRTPMAADALSLQTTLEDGRLVFGTIELEDRHLLLSVNSPRRAERGRAMLEALLGDRLGAPEIVVSTIDELKARDPGETADVPDDVAAETLHAFLDQHFRKTLDDPLDLFGGRTPREVAKTPEGRPKVVEWLKLLENTSAHRGPQAEALASYDTRWLWQELGLADLRR